MLRAGFGRARDRARRARDRLSRLARLGLALNAARATLRFGALVMGIGVLAPASEAMFFPVMIVQYAALGAWLSLRRRNAPL